MAAAGGLPQGVLVRNLFARGGREPDGSRRQAGASPPHKPARGSEAPPTASFPLTFQSAASRTKPRTLSPARQIHVPLWGVHSCLMSLGSLGRQGSHFAGRLLCHG